MLKVKEKRGQSIVRRPVRWRGIGNSGVVPLETVGGSMSARFRSSTTGSSPSVFSAEHDPSRTHENLQALRIPVRLESLFWIS